MWRSLALASVAAHAALTIAAAEAGEWDISAAVATELRVFPGAAAFSRQDGSTVSPALSVEPEVVYEWNQARDRLTLQPFARLDVDDENRSHADLREANWLHVGEFGDLVVGIDRVFWGVTESRHLVDIVNQTDAVEDIDGEDKLGQPMVSLNLESGFGSFGLFVLPGFRERRFPDADARLSGPLPIDGRATFDSSQRRWHADLAVRWAHSIGDWDIGLSQFRGTSREPRLRPAIQNGRPVLVPHYDQIDQTGLDLQLTAGATLWKLEAIGRGGHGDWFGAAVAGLEHSFYQVFGTTADLGLLAEYLYDGRDASAPVTIADDDAFLGARLTLNDAADTALLAGALVDRSSASAMIVIEAERRLADAWKVELEGRFFVNVADGDPLAAIRDDDFVTVRLSRFF